MYEVVILDMNRKPTAEEVSNGYEFYLGLGYYVKSMIRSCNYNDTIKTYMWTIVFDKRKKYTK